MAFLFALNAYSISLKMDTELPQHNTASREISLQKHKLTIKALTEGVIFDDLFYTKNTLNINNLYEKLV